MVREARRGCESHELRLAIDITKLVITSISIYIAIISTWLFRLTCELVVLVFGVLLVRVVAATAAAAIAAI